MGRGSGLVFDGLCSWGFAWRLGCLHNGVVLDYYAWKVCVWGYGNGGDVVGKFISLVGIAHDYLLVYTVLVASSLIILPISRGFMRHIAAWRVSLSASDNLPINFVSFLLRAALLNGIFLFSSFMVICRLKWSFPWFGLYPVFPWPLRAFCSEWLLWWLFGLHCRKILSVFLLIGKLRG